MDILADTNILVRRIKRFDAQHKEAQGSFPSHIQRILVRIEDAFHMLPEKPEVFTEWKKLVALRSVSGLMASRYC